MAEINAYRPSVAQQIINDEIGGIYGSELLRELGEIISYYEIYDKGAQFPQEGAKDYTPANLRFRESRKLINKEARFMFSKPIDVFIDVPPINDTEEAREQAKADAEIYSKLIRKVREKNLFDRALVQSARDCFVGKRIAVVLNFNKSGIGLNFLPSLEFVYDTDPTDINIITKLICFYTIDNHDDKRQQRVYRKKYWMQDGFCWVVEEIRNGNNEVIKTLTPETKTRFSRIPGFVITNDGLTGDIQGESEIYQLAETEKWFSRLSNADIDAERKSMNAIKYTIDVDEKCTENLPCSPGSFWDLISDPMGEGKSGKVGLLEPSMTYTEAISQTLNRLKTSMHDALDVPDVSPDALKGVVSSGKTLKALYWGLIVRCDEKMLAWRPVLESVMRTIIDGARLYPESAKAMIPDLIPEGEFSVRVDNSYPLPEDEAEEKQIDMQEVNSRTRSIKSYLRKWRDMTDTAADAEIKQIALEQRMMEDIYLTDTGGDM